MFGHHAIDRIVTLNFEMRNSTEERQEIVFYSIDTYICILFSLRVVKLI